ncbi:MAG: TIGR01244 family sulfur transferase [Paracoccaceae bacterium]
MDIRPLSPTYAVSPQISAEDATAIADAGFVMVICNRPDGEVPPSHQADSIGTALRAAGLSYEVLPLTHHTMTPDNIARQRDLAAQAGGPVLAYCASGTRSSIAWALGQAGHMTTDDIVMAAGNAGYDLRGLAGTLDALTKAQS